MIDKNKLLRGSTSGYTLKKPLTITVRKNVIDILNNIYIPNGERGGVMWLEAIDERNAEIKKVTILQNLSGTASGFAPSEVAMQNAIDEIMQAGCLPLVFHTHPTNLGLNLYDNKQVNFYLRASRPDRIFAKNAIVDDISLYMPEMIFVQDNRYNEGYALAVYGGKILPNGFSRLSTLQIFSIVAWGYLWLTKGLNATAWAIAVALILWEETKRPKYNSTENGDFIISF